MAQIDALSRSSDPRIGLVYLARQTEGQSPLTNFVQSYIEQPAGVHHDLIVIFKGYTSQADLTAARRIFDPVRHSGIELPDVGFDIGAYLSAARRLDHDYVCFLNTFTEITDMGWLHKLYANAASPHVGIVGATASYESLFDSLALLHKVIWLCNEVRISYDRPLDYYFDWFIAQNCPQWKAGYNTVGISTTRDYLQTVANRFRSYLAKLKLRRYDEWWTDLLKSHLSFVTGFPTFPNPHVRSNGFMIRRRRLLELDFRSVETKIDACLFESGREGLTSRLTRSGLKALVVGRDGVGYDLCDWSQSGTFRLGDQENLLLSDNQTRNFAAMSPGAKATHVRMTWGNYLHPAPRDFPDLGFEFRVSGAVTGYPGGPRRTRKIDTLGAKIDDRREFAPNAYEESLKRPEQTVAVQKKGS